MTSKTEKIKSVRRNCFSPWYSPEAIKKYKSKKSTPQKCRDFGQLPFNNCQEKWCLVFLSAPLVVAPAPGQWPEIFPKEMLAIHHIYTHTHKLSSGTRVQKIVLAKWNLTVSKVFPSSEAESKPKLNSYQVVFQLFLSVSIVKYNGSENRESTTLQRKKVYWPVRLTQSCE